MLRNLAALASALLVLTACEGGPVPENATDPVAAEVRFEGVPKWMAGYCRKAADDLGYPVLCPRQLPTMIDIVPCRGPTPENELWGEYCFDYVLDSLFRGPPGYRGPFSTNRRAGHLALWSISPTSDMYRGGLFGCPGHGSRRAAARLRGHSGRWWSCPASRRADLNSGHLAFQWVSNGVIYGLSVHGITRVSGDLVRRLASHVELVGPES